MFIVYEGIDGSGKDTQIDMCSRMLRRVYRDRILTMNPTLENDDTQRIKKALTEAGSEINPITIANLFIRNMIEVSYNVQDLINRGYYILMNRWYYSTLVYNGIDKNYFNTISGQINNLVNTGKLLVPDLVVYLDIEPVVAMERIIKRGKPIERYESLTVLKNVRDRYISIFYTDELQTIPKNKIFIVNGQMDSVDLTNTIIEGVYNEIGI